MSASNWDYQSFNPSSQAFLLSNSFFDSSTFVTRSLLLFLNRFNMQSKLILITALAAVNAAVVYQEQVLALRAVVVVAAAAAPAIVNAAPASSMFENPPG
jgi:ABC-type enterochelin transport system ATPase subunit